MARWSVRMAGVVCLAACWIGRAPAQAPQPPQGDLLDETRRLNDIAAQKLEYEVRQALTAARQLAERQPDLAADRLRQAQQQLDADTALDGKRKTTLYRQVQAQLRAVEALAARAASATNSRQVRRPTDPRESERQQAAQIHQALDEIAALQRAGRLADAERKAAELARQYPDHPAVAIMRRNAALSSRLADARREVAETEQRLGATIGNVQRAATPPAGDVTFPKDWAAKTARRTKDARLTDKEKALVAALKAPVTTAFKGAHLDSVIDYLSAKLGRPIVLDRAALSEANVAYDTPVNLSFPRPVAMRTALRTLMSQLGLAYVIKDEVIQVTTVQKAREMMVTRVYYLGDLVQGLGPLGNAWTYGPQLVRTGPGPYDYTWVSGQELSRKQTVENARQIVALIQQSIEPESWSSRGGAGTITFNEATMSIVVRNSAEVHLMLKGGSLAK